MSKDIDRDSHFGVGNMKRCVGLTTQLEQRINIHFCVKLGWNFTQIKTALTTAYARPLSDSSVYFWMKKFREGHTRIVDLHRAPKKRTGRSRRNIRAVGDMVTSDRRMFVKVMSARTGIARQTIHQILRLDLKLVKKSTRYMPKDLQTMTRTGG